MLFPAKSKQNVDFWHQGAIATADGIPDLEGWSVFHLRVPVYPHAWCQMITVCLWLKWKLSREGGLKLKTSGPKGLQPTPVWKISTCLNNPHYNAPGELEESMNLAMPSVMETGHTFACSEHQSNFFTPCAIKHGENSQGFQYENNPPWATKLIWCSCGSPKSLVCFWRLAECITEVCLPCS